MSLGPRQQARNIERLFELLGPIPSDGKAALRKSLPPDRVTALLKELQRNLGGISWRDKPAVNVLTAASLLDCSRSAIYKLSHEGRLEMLRSPTGRTLVSVKSITALQDQAMPWTAPDNTNTGRAAKTDRP